MFTEVNEGDTSGNNVGPMVPDRFFLQKVTKEFPSFSITQQGRKGHEGGFVIPDPRAFIDVCKIFAAFVILL